MRRHVSAPKLLWSAILIGLASTALVVGMNDDRTGKTAETALVDPVESPTVEVDLLVAGEITK